MVLTPQKKLELMRTAEMNPGVAFLNVVEMLRQEMDRIINEKVAAIEAKTNEKISSVESSLTDKVVLKHIEKLKGDQGEPADEQAIIEAITPVAVSEAVKASVRAAVAAIRQPQDGRTPTRDELLAIISPLIPSRSKDGKTPTKDELVSLIMPLIPEIKGDGLTEDDVVEIVKKLLPEAVVLDGEDIIKKINSASSSAVIPASRISGLPRIPKDKGGKHGGGDTITVSTVAPSNPFFHQLWLDIN